MSVDTVMITFEADNKYHAKKMHKALVKFMRVANTGGDVDLFIGKGDKPEHCGFVGHDTTIVSVGMDIIDKEYRR